jgi:hypothetical protein
MVDAGRGRWIKRWKKEYYKFGSEHTGSATFVEEQLRHLLSLQKKMAEFLTHEKDIYHTKVHL